MTQAEIDIQARLDRLARYFDLGALAQADCSAKGIARYYRLSRHAYSRYHDKGNAVHMGLSEGDIWRPEDMYGQAAFIEEHLGEARNVLELATGRGMNALWLARRHPSVRFHGIDLTPAQLTYARKDSADVANFTASEGDFHDLSGFASESQDLVFVVEALCHSDRKQEVLDQAHRVLRPHGTIIVIDGYRANGEAEQITDQALRLLARGMAVPDFMPYQDFQDLVEECPFEIVEEHDRSQQIMPSLKRFEGLANRFMSPRLKMRIMRALLPKPLLHNVVSGYLFPALMEAGAISYWLTVLRKT
ncbi:MAG: methyltransferase domain-containing protein [Pseudomonadota bacterium]